jgi:hypothetical protein
MAVIAMMRGKTKDGYHHWCNNKHYKKNHGVMYVCRRPPRYVPYKGTYVPYDGTFGAPDQG